MQRTQSIHHRLRRRRSPARTRRLDRRGVSSVLSMMFLVLFGSLAATMAVVAHGNLRTADSGLKVSRAMSAAETGLVFGTRRLDEEAQRFIITRGEVDASLAERLWIGQPQLPQHGSVMFLQDNGELTDAGNYGIAHAVLDQHLADGHTITPEPGDASLPTLDTSFGTLRLRPIALRALQSGEPDPDGPYFRLKYELLEANDEGAHIRITSQGVFDDVRRTIAADLHIGKRIEYALLSPSRIMIGKNVMIEGPIGSLYGVEPNEMIAANSHPLRMMSDFYGLSPSLDVELDQFYALVVEYDVSGDGRLRPNHPDEGSALAGSGFVDMTGDGYVSDFDLFLMHYGNADGIVVYDAALAGMPATFTADLDLARLIDFSVPDRDGDGEITVNDHALGFADGIIDWRDNYAKVHGRLDFAVSRNDWESSNPQISSSYQEVVQGPINHAHDQPPTFFNVAEHEMHQISTSMLDSSQSWFYQQAQTGADFEQQVNDGGTVVCPAYDLDDPPWWADLCHVIDDDLEWEGVPYDSPGHYDYYLRPVFKGFTFTNVRIPKGLNGLFEDCTFIGVTFIETTEDNTDDNWNFAGAVVPDNETPPSFEPRFPDLFVEIDGEDEYDTRDFSNNVRFHNCTFLGSISGDQPQAYTHWRNKVQMTGETRFYLDPNDPDLLEQDDASDLQTKLLSIPASDREELAKSSILMPDWSMDVGSFTTDPNADPGDVPMIKLRGTIVAGILDIRGRAEVNGTLLMTFRPTLGEPPLTFVPSNCWSCLPLFSTTIGYFGPQYGDHEGHDTTLPTFEGYGAIRLRYDPNAKLPDGIPWPVRIEAVADSYTEGGSL